jgi:hypothetical protein
MTSSSPPVVQVGVRDAVGDVMGREEVGGRSGCSRGCRRPSRGYGRAVAVTFEVEEHHVGSGRCSRRRCSAGRALGVELRVAKLNRPPTFQKNADWRAW